MTLSFKHAFQSAKGDPEDDTLVRPSNWNEDHDVTLAANKVIGRSDSGDGSAEEITCTPFAQTLLAVTSLDDLVSLLGGAGSTTGDVKLTLKTTADDGWVMMEDQTIGHASSTADSKGPEFESLFKLIWDAVDNSWAAVTGGRGANAQADWDAHKKIRLPKVLGRAMAIAGNGSGLSGRALGEQLGEEDHQLGWEEMPIHTHTGTTGGQSTDHTHQYQNAITSGMSATAGGGVPLSSHNTLDTGGTSTDHVHGFETDLAGDDVGHNNMQPTVFMNVMVKL